MVATHYDYVIVGAGAAGCAVANRLSADPDTTVLLLEAGGKNWSPLVHMPVGFTKLSGPRYNWEFSTVPQPQLNNREMWYPQGRTLGGSTSINAMIYIRGQKEDYEAWAALGNKHWGFEQVLPFFRRAEANERLNDRYHSSVGAVNVTEQVQHNPLSKAFVRAAQELGVTFIADFNGAVQEGVSWYDVTQKNARRESTATAYLKPIRSRKNLDRRHPRSGTQDHRTERPSHRSGHDDRREAGARTRRPRVDLERRGRQLAPIAAAVRDRTGR